MLARILTSEHQNSGSLEKASLRNDAVKKEKKKVPSEKKKINKFLNFCQRTERFPTARLSGQPCFPAGDVSSSESTRGSPAGASSGRGGARATIYKATEQEIQGKATRGCCRPCSPPQNPLWSQTQGPKPKLGFGVSPSRPPHCGPSPLFPHE